MKEKKKQKSTRALDKSQYCFYVLSYKVCIKIWLTCKRTLWWSVEHQEEIRIAVDILDFLWELSKPLL